MTTTQLTVASAPRDTEGLSKIGRFNLRMLAQEIGLFDTEEGKTSFMGLTNEGQVKALQAKLAEIDGASSTPARTPSNKGTKGGGGKAANGAATAAGASQAAAATSPASSTAGNQSAGAASAALLAKLDTLASSVNELREEVNNLNTTLASVQGMTAANNRFVTVAIGLSLKLAEEVLGAGAEQVLGAVMEDMPMVENALSNLPRADEGDQDPGNE